MPYFNSSGGASSQGGGGLGISVSGEVGGVDVSVAYNQPDDTGDGTTKPPPGKTDTLASSFAGLGLTPTQLVIAGVVVLFLFMRR